VSWVQRVFHIPSHLSYVSKLASDSFTPVPSPSGKPLRVMDLIALPAWDFFDVLHLHTVELATAADLASLSSRLWEAGKGLFVTLHDLVPSIETDHTVFAVKTRLATQAASSVVTLTHAAGEQVWTRFGVKPAVIPHGYAVGPNLVSQRGGGASGLLVFGALRPNRNLLAVVRAWRLLPAARPPLRVLLRSFGASDQERYADELAELEGVVRAEPDLTVETTTGMLPPGELVERCQHATALVMPYHRITHSGQLELARDLGISAVVPDIPTVRAQLGETEGDEHPCVWFPTIALSSPSEFAGYLENVSELSNKQVAKPNYFAQYRTKEHDKLLVQYGAEYNRSCERKVE
jgi:hypothetical protein